MPFFNGFHHRVDPNYNSDNIATRYRGMPIITMSFMMQLIKEAESPEAFDDEDLDSEDDMSDVIECKNSGKVIIAAAAVVVVVVASCEQADHLSKV